MTTIILSERLINPKRIGDNMRPYFSEGIDYYPLRDVGRGLKGVKGGRVLVLVRGDPHMVSIVTSAGLIGSRKPIGRYISRYIGADAAQTVPLSPRAGWPVYRVKDLLIVCIDTWPVIDSRIESQDAVAWAEMYPTVRDLCIHLYDKFEVKSMQVLVSDAFSEASGGGCYSHGEIRDVVLESPDYSWAEKVDTSEIVTLIPYWFPPVMWSSLYQDAISTYTVVGVKSPMGIYDKVATEAVMEHIEKTIDVRMNRTAMDAAIRKYSRLYGATEEEDFLKVKNMGDYNGDMFV